MGNHGNGTCSHSWAQKSDFAPKVTFGALLGPWAPTIDIHKGLWVVWEGPKRTFSGNLHFWSKSAFVEQDQVLDAKMYFTGIT